uniref:Uncharacterized protein n=1 Tax=Caenorhabditis japonica TaxID=281687 RepID=A0A8R1EVY4_CAEJA
MTGFETSRSRCVEGYILSLFPASSPCSSNNCEHFCFASSCKGSVGCEPVKCGCADGWKLVENGKCVPDPQWVDPFGCDADKHFTCAISKKCVPKTNLCDGDDDCGDGSDEDPNGACKDYKCVGQKFQCDGTTCLPMSFVCDGKTDCLDGTDEWEKTCHNPPRVQCSDNEFRCSNTKCIPKSKRCNNQRDCENGDDERDCPTNRSCLLEEFRCGNGLCIKQSHVCDGKRQCLDGLDEAHCEQEQCLDPLRIWVGG